MGGNHQTSIHLKLVVWSSRYKSTNFHPNFRALEIGGSRKEGKFPWTFTWIWAGNNMQTTVFFSFFWWMPVGKNNFWLKIVCFGKHHFKSVTLNGWYFKHSPLGGAPKGMAVFPCFGISGRMWSHPFHNVRYGISKENRILGNSKKQFSDVLYFPLKTFP